MFNKDLYYKKYLKYKNKYITLQSQIGGTTIRPPPGGGPARAALPPENDDVHILPILPYRQNATRGLNPPVVTAPVAPPPENENVPISPSRQNATSGLNPHVVPPSVSHQNPFTSDANTSSENNLLCLRPRLPPRQNTTVVPLSVSHQNETSRVRARIPSVSFGYGQPDPTNVSAAPGYDSERRRRSENEE